MPLCDPEDKQVVEALAAEFLKMADARGFESTNILQAVIAVAAAVIGQEANGDLNVALDWLGRFQRSLLSAIEIGHKTGER
jgi:hypothetical protein